MMRTAFVAAKAEAIKHQQQRKQRNGVNIAVTTAKRKSTAWQYGSIEKKKKYQAAAKAKGSGVPVA